MARRLPALGHDPCLERAAAAYANVDPGLAPSLPAAFVEHVLHWAGCPDPSASVFAQTTDGDDPADFVDWLATELAGTDATAVGVVGVELGASAGWRRVGFVVARRFELRPVPSSGEPGTALALQLKVDPAYAAARVHVTQPRGQTRELPVGLGGGWAVASVPLAEEKGRQWVEVMAEAARGPEVLALFPVEVGRPLSHLWVGEAKADESGISTGAAAEELIGRLLARERGRFELPPLERDERLDAVARAYSQEMAETGEIAHVSVASGSIADRLAAAGYEFRFAAENLARGASLVDAHEGLLRSPGHRAAMLEPAVSRLGVGVARGRSPGGGPMWFVTQIFVRPFEARDPG